MQSDEIILNIKPCIKCGFCCTQGPCGYGEWDSVKKECIFLSKPNTQKQRFCLKYKEIRATAIGWQYTPAFSAGCGSSINSYRSNIIHNLIKKNAKNNK